MKEMWFQNKWRKEIFFFKWIWSLRYECTLPVSLHWASSVHSMVLEDSDWRYLFAQGTGEDEVVLEHGLLIENDASANHNECQTKRQNIPWALKKRRTYNTIARPWTK
jgi:hypothetical protein